MTSHIITYREDDQVRNKGDENNDKKNKGKQQIGHDNNQQLVEKVTHAMSNVLCLFPRSYIYLFICSLLIQENNLNSVYRLHQEWKYSKPHLKNDYRTMILQ